MCPTGSFCFCLLTGSIYNLINFISKMFFLNKVQTHLSESSLLQGAMDQKDVLLSTFFPDELVGQKEIS